MKKLIAAIILASITITGLLVGCDKNNLSNIKEYKKSETLDFNFNVEPETFKIEIESNGVRELASKPLANMEVSDLKNTGDSISWNYKQKDINVEIQKKDNYLDVNIKSTKKEENEFTWPKVNGEGYLLPLNQGKYIPSDDELWKEYLKENEIKGLEGLSMQFFAVNQKDYSLVYVIENPFNNDISFNTEENIELNFKHKYPSINEKREYGFRIYVTPKNPVDVAKTYKGYLVENGEFKTLEEKAKNNKKIERLYGAPHAYFWDTCVISEGNIKWNTLIGNFPKDLSAWIQELLKSKVEDGEEIAEAFNDINNLNYVDKYTKNRIIKGLSSVLQLEEFHNSKIFNDIDNQSKSLIDKGLENLNPVELIDLNKRLLKSKLGNSVDSIEEWANENTIDILDDIKASGLDNMWIGLDDWREGFRKPEFIKKANEMGYLIGTYDSYHSIHRPGEEQWITAAFSDKTLFEDATVTKKDGSKIEGFKGVGRKLNPTLAMPSVKERVNGILNTGLQFNSWFLDTDGTGEVFDDYSPNHITTEEQDIQARIKRMEYFQEEHKMVVGTEGGNDFANKTIAFAHGIETPSFSWMDKDMSKNKDSKYYVGRYYASYGGVPEMFSKQIPLKEIYKKLFIDTNYTIPLYKLVYNDSVITTHWWGWGTLKFQDYIQDRMLYEILYNVPPLYHLDRVEWEKHKDEIVEHSKVWSKFSKKAINKEMTDFKILSKDKLVQMTSYGNDLKVIANFSGKKITVEGENIEAKSLIIIEGNNKTIYTP
ncbi:glycoside hydrolase [Clostridium taeniosporum]|uniref:Glycosyl hydrolase n=1 Tax=Clostridium taeniosporum TaxID=394958 RepID=A0A1D7XPA8_9CLOT|nr:glycoside hydrolase [Clostridium taeniosporum]AOR25156.1 hypothetical protein BGI42_15570 [Clostridium taeniosporum]